MPSSSQLRNIECQCIDGAPGFSNHRMLTIKASYGAITSTGPEIAEYAYGEGKYGAWHTVTQSEQKEDHRKSAKCGKMYHTKEWKGPKFVKVSIIAPSQEVSIVEAIALKYRRKKSFSKTNNFANRLIQKTINMYCRSHTYYLYYSKFAMTLPGAW